MIKYNWWTFKIPLKCIFTVYFFLVSMWFHDYLIIQKTWSQKIFFNVISYYPTRRIYSIKGRYRITAVMYYSFGRTFFAMFHYHFYGSKTVLKIKNITFILCKWFRISLIHSLSLNIFCAIFKFDNNSNYSLNKKQKNVQYFVTRRRVLELIRISNYVWYFLVS
jgi:hypothetical protein